MTPAQKSSALDMIAARAQTAEDRGLTATAKSWRDRYAVVEARPAAEIVGNTDFGSREGVQVDRYSRSSEGGEK